MVQTTPSRPRKPGEPYLARFEEHFGKATSGPDWLSRLRRDGIERFAELGFPTVEQEDWRFTNVAPVAKLPARPVMAATHPEWLKDVLKGLPFAGMNCHRLVFVNGYYSPALSAILPHAPEIQLGSLAAALATQDGLLETACRQFSAEMDNAFGALNTAFLSDGAFVRVPAGMALEEPVHALYLSTAPENGASTHPRNIIRAEANSRLTFIESYFSLTDTAHFTNGVSQLLLGENAMVEHCKLQREHEDAFHLASIHAHLERGANALSHSIALGARLSRNSIRAKLAGEGIDCVLNGLYLTRGEQLADHHMVVEHAQPHCNSHEYFNGILGGRSKAVFHGRILVQPEAQKTDAKQTNKNLLLADTATVDTKPQLEIYADDVKCTHGATVGQLNEESVFYLRARGINQATARRILIHAFAGEIIERIQCERVRQELNDLVWARLEEDPHVAEGQ